MSPPSRFNLSGLLLLALVLSGCITNRPDDIAALSRFDPLSADPDGLVVRIESPSNLRLRPGDAVMQLSKVAARPDLEFDERFVLALEDASAAGNAQRLFVAPADRERFRRTQAKARSGRGEGRGTLSVHVSGGCRVGPLPEGPLVVRTLMRIEPNGRFIPLVEQDLRAAAASGAWDGMPLCGS